MVFGFTKLSTLQYKREITEKILSLSQHFPAIVLTGARQTGKTTLIRQVFPDYGYISLDSPADAQLAEENPQAFLKRYPPPLLIDEVQYAPKLFRHLKLVIDQNRQINGQFILTGSQKFTLMKEVSDSLAGRCALLEIEGLSIFELGKVVDQYIREFGNEGVIARGLYPQLWADQKILAADFYRSYLGTYIERDVRQLLNIGSSRDFDRFMRACAFRTGQLLNKSEISKEVGVTSKTINEWLSVLEASNQIVLLEPYFKNIGKRLTKSPKLYFNDCGLVCYLLGLNEKTLGESYLKGAIWETFIFAELRKYLSLHKPEASLWFYRDQQREVDFVIDYGSKIHLLESKWKELPNSRDFANTSEVAKGLSQVHKDLFVLCRTSTTYPVELEKIAVAGFNMHEFLEQLLKG